MKKRLLLVDDEPPILLLLERMFARMSSEWNIRTAANAAKALEMLQQQSADVVVSDLDMPGMRGDALLVQIAQDYPETVRILFSGSTDEERGEKLLETTHQVLMKPDSLKEISDVVRRSLMVRDILQAKDLELIVNQVKTLPSLPNLYLELVQELRNPESSLQRIGEIIGQDLAMSAKVLQLINSAFFGLREHVNSPAQAANLLGVTVLKSLVLMANVFSQFDKQCAEEFSPEELWRHGLAVAANSRLMANKSPSLRSKAEDSFMAGLFHDLGKLVLMANMPEPYRLVMDSVNQEGMNLVDAEAKHIGATHAEVGAYLLGIWGFSDPLIEAAGFHHEPSRQLGSDPEIVAMVHVANALDHEFTQQGGDPGLDEDFLRETGMDEQLDEWKKICSLQY